MKKHLYVFVTVVMSMLPGIFMNTLVAQPQVFPEASPENISKQAIPQEKPVQYPVTGGFQSDEQHVLGGLNTQERSQLSQESDPPIIGVLRSFTTPVDFSLDKAQLPEEGEISFAGGRLIRVNDYLLVWKAFFRSEGAKAIRLHFSEGYFPQGVSVSYFSKDDYYFTQTELGGKLAPEGYYSTSTFADFIELQVTIPIEAIGQGLSFKIPEVIHVGKDYLGESTLDACAEDVNCTYASGYANIADLKQAVSQLTFLVGSSYYICSGALINDTRSIDFQPFLLTANHCFSTQASAASLEAVFDLWTNSCNGTTNSSTYLVNGSNLIATNSESDFTFVLLYEKPGGYSYYLGWTAASVASGSTLHSVHHPGGSPQKYSRHNKPSSSSYNCGSNFHHTVTLGGHTAGGSSGGPIVNSSNQIVGQLYGTCYSGSYTLCTYSTYNNIWGKFETSYANNNLQYWLYSGGASVAMSTSPTSSLSFGSVLVGANSTLTVTVTNSGTIPNYMNLEAGSASISGTNADQFSIVSSTSLYLRPGQSGTFSIKFQPTSAGTKSATLSIPHNANNISTPKTITLTGTATAPADPCTSITSIAACGSANYKTYTGGGSGSWYTSTVNPCGYTTPGIEKIYSFVPTVTGVYSIEVTTANGYVDYLWKASSCSSTGWTCIQDITSPGTYGALSWTAGTTYYILLDDEDNTTGTHTFYINCASPCSSVTSIAGTGVANSKTYTGGGTGQWNQASSSACGFTCPGVEKIYSFIPTVTGPYKLVVTAASGYVDYMWKASSCASTGWTCIDDISIAGSYGPIYWTAGVTYYLLLDDENSTVGTHTFYLELYNPCNEVSAIGGIGSGYAKTYSSMGHGVWNQTAANVCGYLCPGYERMYSFTPTTTGTYGIQVASTTNQYVDYLWKASTCASTGWTCIDDVIYPGVYGAMTWTAGTTYYLLLDAEYDTAIQSFYLVNVTVTPPTSILANPTSVCPGSQSSLTVNPLAPTGYTTKWYTGSCGGTLIGSGNFISVNPTVTTTYYARYEGSVNSACASITITVNPVPAQPGTISGPTTVCAGSSNTYSVAAVSGATSYTWTLPSGWTGTSTSNVISTTAGSTGGTISVTANNGCGASPVRTLTVTCNTIPQTPVFFSCTGTVCLEQTVSCSVLPVSGATSYNWIFPIGWTCFSNTTSFTCSAISSGLIQVSASNSCGNSNPASAYIEVINVPNQPGSISGSTSVCSGNMYTYSVPAVSGATSYNWTLPSGWSGSSTTNSITTVAGTSSGNISVSANNTCGSGAIRSLAVTASPGPGVTTPISGQNTVCLVTYGVTYYVSPMPTGVTLNWTYSGTGVNIVSGQGTNMITVNYTASATPGIWSVTPSSACGSGPPETLAITITQFNVDLSVNTAGCGTVSGAGTYYCNQSVTVTATPTGGSTFSNWTENGNVVSTNPTYTFSITNNRNLVANFTNCTTCTYTIGTSVSPAGAGFVSGGGSVLCGSLVNLFATPNSCYTFLYWTENGSPIATINPYSFTALMNRNLVAVFTPTTLSAPTGATANPSSICTGISSTLTCNPSAPTGYTAKWYTSSCGGSLVGSGNSITVNPSLTTTYYVRYEGTCGNSTCVTTTVTVCASLVVNAGPDASTCAGNSVQLTSTVSGGVPPYTYLWSPTTGLNSPTVANPVATPLVTTTYTLFVTDANSNTGSDQVTVNVVTSGWTNQIAGFSSTSRSVDDICAVSSSVAWAIASDATGSGYILDYTRTNNGGSTWTAGSIVGYTGYGAAMVMALDYNTAWIPIFGPSANGGGYILKTTDGGTTWTPTPSSMFTAPTGFPNNVYFWNANLGVCFGDPNGGYFEIYTTSNGGTTWSRVASSNIPAPLSGEMGYTNCFSVIGNTIWFTTSSGRVFKSTNNGSSWSAVTTPLAGLLYLDVKFRDASNGILYARGGATSTAVCRSTDGGATWATFTYSGPMYRASLDNIPGTTKWVSTGNASGAAGCSLSDDDGATWANYPNTGNVQFYDVDMYSDNVGWAGGLNTTGYGMFKYTQCSASAYTLTVASSNPSSGVNVTVSPPDNNGLGNGTTQFTRSYNSGASVSLTAPLTSNNNCFSYWLKDGVSYSNNNSIVVSVTQNATYTAVYITCCTNTITITSNAGSVNIGVTPPDNNGLSAGVTTFTRTYNCGQAVTLTAPTTLSGLYFQTWKQNGVTVAGNPLNINVTANDTYQAYYTQSPCAPAWVPVANMQNNMTIIGQVQFSGTLSTNPNDVIGAFVGTECRGIANPTQSLNGVFFLTIASNLTSGETVTFKAWNSTTCLECPVSETVPFVSQNSIGTIQSPYQLHACPLVTPVIIPCPAGYTWFSINKDRGSWAINTVLGPWSSQGGMTHTSSQNDRIIGQSSFATFYGTSWVGSLTTLDPLKMYIANFANSDTIVVYGSAVGLGPVSLGQGYTWFGFLPQCNENINTALGGISTLPAQNDRIIGQSSFATYYGTSWVGSLTTMNPTKGYKSSLTSSSTFTYPACSKSGPAACEDLSVETPEWTETENMLYTMTIVAKVKDGEGNFIVGDSYQLGSFSETSCRGITRQPDCMPGYFFVSVASDRMSGEHIRFRIRMGGQVYDIVETIPFKEGQGLGSIDDPVILTLPLNATFPASETGFYLGNAQPNPFTNETGIQYILPEESTVSLKIYSVTGQLLRRYAPETAGAGSHQFMVRAMEEGAGIYFYTLEAISANRVYHATKRMVQLK